MISLVSGVRSLVVVAIKKHDGKYQKHQGWVCVKYQVSSYFLLPPPPSAGPLGSSVQCNEIPLRNVALN